MTDQSVEQRVFFAWQSDIEPSSTSRALIRAALTKAAAEVQKELASSERIVLDEATRGEPGSPNIPLTIFRKISEAAVVVADVTTIGVADSGRKVQNPNVLIEVGHAAALLGWGRVVLLVDKARGNVSELPFDIDRHRVLEFSCGAPSGEADRDKSVVANATSDLAGKLTTAINLVLRINPDRPVAVALDVAEVRRARDLRTLERVLNFVHPEVIRKYCDDAPHRLDLQVFHFFGGLDAIMSSWATRFYDEALGRMLNEIHKHWSRALSFGNFYAPGIGDFYIWYGPGDCFPSKASEEAYGECEAALVELAKGVGELMAYLHSSYVELDLNALGNAAWAAYLAKK